MSSVFFTWKVFFSEKKQNLLPGRGNKKLPAADQYFSEVRGCQVGPFHVLLLTQV